MKEMDERPMFFSEEEIMRMDRDQLTETAVTTEGFYCLTNEAELIGPFRTATQCVSARDSHNRFIKESKEGGL